MHVGQFVRGLGRFTLLIRADKASARRELSLLLTTGRILSQYTSVPRLDEPGTSPGMSGSARNASGGCGSPRHHAGGLGGYQQSRGATLLQADVRIVCDGVVYTTFSTSLSQGANA